MTEPKELINPLILGEKQPEKKSLGKSKQIVVSADVHMEIAIEAAKRTREYGARVELGQVVEELWRSRDAINADAVASIDAALTEEERSLLEGVLRLCRSKSYDDQQLVKTIEIFIKRR